MMALKIVRGDDPITVEQLVICLYGNPGLGKSTLAFTADAPLVLDFDRGSHRAANRGDTVQVESWSEVSGISAEDLAPYKTIVVDTAGRALDLLTVDIIRRNAKMGRGGALTLPGYGALKSEFTAWLKFLRTLKKDVVLVAHASEEKSGDDILERLDVQGGSKGEIYKSADAIGRLSMVGGKRVLNFSPTDTSFGKNPGNLEPLAVPHVDDQPLFLAGVVDTIKTRLNSLTEAQTARKSAVADLKAKIEEARTAEEFTGLIKEVKGADKDILPVVKGLLHATATKAGMEFKGGAYEAKS